MAQLEREKPVHDTVMDVTAEQIARVYAKAFLAAASRQPDPAELVAEVEAVVGDVLSRAPQLETVLGSSLVSPEEKEQVLGRVFGNRVSRIVVDFLKVLSRHGRLDLLRPIARILRRLHGEQSGITEVEVRVATELNDDLRNEIQDRLQRALNTKPVLRVSVDPELIAGIWVRVGDQVFDGSARTQLEHVRRRMIDLAAEKIETQPERFVKV